MPRVVVVGGGLAGCWAAITAAGAGAEVTLVRRSPGATSMSSGAIDAVPPVEAADPEGWLRRLPLTDARHVYLAGGRAPGLAEIEAELVRLAAALGAAGLGVEVRLRAPALVAAITGQVRLSGCLQGTVAAGDLRGRRRVAVAGIAGLSRVDPTAIAASLVERLGIEARPVLLALGGLAEATADLDDATAARALDAPGGARALGAALGRVVEGLDLELVLLPAILGLGDAGAVRRQVEQVAGVRVAEMLSPPPSAPGWRLGRALERALATGGVELVTAAALGTRRRDGRVVEVTTTAGMLPCDAVVLAGGRFLGGGLTQDARPREPLLDLPVFAGEDPVDGLAAGDLAQRTRFRSQPVLGAGLRVDGAARPVDRFGVPPFSNVHACGAILAGIETTLSGGGLGVSAWTAGVAGRAASAAVVAV